MKTIYTYNSQTGKVPLMSYFPEDLEDLIPFLIEKNILYGDNTQYILRYDDGYGDWRVVFRGIRLCLIIH